VTRNVFAPALEIERPSSVEFRIGQSPSKWRRVRAGPFALSHEDRVGRGIRRWMRNCASLSRVELIGDNSAQESSHMRSVMAVALGLASLSLMSDAASARQCPYGFQRNGPYCVPIAQQYRKRFYGVDTTPGPRVYGGQYDSRIDTRVDGRVGSGGCPAGYYRANGGCLSVRR
jgi:hypothetical protein